MKSPALAFFLLLTSSALLQPAKDSCVECHTVMEGNLQRPATLIKNDVHTASRLSCADCHGGDPQSDDPLQAMSAAKGFRGKTARTAIPKLCSTCHSDPNFMRKYRPQQRVDQFQLYQTSVHGKRLATGDTTVATCVDCHSVHDIRPVKDAASPVHPLKLPATCGHCHADKTKMARYKISTNQLDEYRTSVHWEALTKRGDLSAPNCASCHGNHGAKPPQVESVAAVCGSCHVLFEKNFALSAHKPVFTSDSGGGCVVCHSNHAIHKPSSAMLDGVKSVCTPCHESASEQGKTATRLAQSLNGLDKALIESERLLSQADKYGMEVSEAQVKLMDGKESLVKARLALHTFREGEVRKPVDAGMAIAKETLEGAKAALHEKDVRRNGLAVSVFCILLAILAIWFLIRRMESNNNGAINS
ncbi:MAG: cytochrome c3 family protein [Candidatus Solibacter usitatus]|nr:cytochrome c3 family protein [Candidatus Solibacter usitatus]